jgi:hypothetical protein
MRLFQFPFAVVALVGAAVCILAHAVSAESNVAFVPASKIRVTDAFWKPLLDRNRTVTIPHILRMCREAGIVANFERVAGLRDGDYHGLPNWDEFLYKAVEAACYGLQQHPSRRSKRNSTISSPCWPGRRTPTATCARSSR